MADINQIITIGVGTPADIEHFILVGLNGSEDPPPVGNSGNGTRYSTRYRHGWIY